MTPRFRFPAWPLLATLLVVPACGRQPEVGAKSSAAAPDRTGVVVLDESALDHAGIAIEPAQSKARVEQLIAPGLMALDETRTARVGSLQEGLILDARAQVGDRVAARQLLATMHGHALHDAWAGYRKAVADRRRWEKELAYAIGAHERAGRLYASKAIALQELQRAEVEHVSAAQMVEMAKAEVSRSIEELEHVGVSVTTATEESLQEIVVGSGEQIPVRSPMGGVVLERLVTPGTTVVPGTPLFVVSDLSMLWAIAEVDESRLAQVKVGRPVEVVVAAYPTERFGGTITFIGDTVNPKTRRVTVRSSVPNRDGRLKPEMFATVALGQGEPQTMVVVPQAAIQTIDGRTSVFVAEGSGRFKPRVVEIGSEMDGLIPVKSGLAPGERVVVAGSFVLKSEFLKSRAGSDH